MIGGAIKVVDKLDTFDTTKPDSSLPPPSTGPSCCARLIDDSSDTETEINSQPSIYGDDITSVPTEILVGKAIEEDQNLTFAFTGIAHEFKPLIAVTEINKKTKFTFDLNDFDDAEDEFSIIKGSTGEIITSFSASKGIKEVEFNSADSDFYVILKDDIVLGIIETVDDLNTAVIEEIRRKYIQ